MISTFIRFFVAFVATREFIVIQLIYNIHNKQFLEVPDRNSIIDSTQFLFDINLLTLNMRQYIPKADDLLDQIYPDKEINIIEKSYTLNKRKFTLFDISLNGYGQEEDKKYIRSVFYRRNIRRGNTIIENSKKYAQFARKGTPKILDIKLEHIQYFLNKNKNNIEKAERNIAEIIFEGVNIAFQDGKKVQLIKTEKVNGQNAQVSYIYEYDAWIICSKNVSLLASSVQDLSIYKESRYNYALLIAEQWFKDIANLKKEQIKELKKLLDGYTAVGEFCGHKDYQHLVRYQEVGIKWFAIVDNYSDEFCLDPLKTKKQLQKLGFKVVKMKSIILTASSDAFYSELQKLYLKTASAGLQDQEYGMEGSIVYFVVPQIAKNGIGKQITVGAGKLKTLQYRYYRKIRQKISRYISRKEPKTELIKKYKQEIIELEKSNQSRAPFPHDYYVKILTTGLELVEATSIKEEKLRGNFISLLKIIFYCLYKRISLKKNAISMLNDQNFMEKVSEIPFSKYNGLGCSTKIIYIVLGLPGMFKTYLAKKLRVHFQKINMPYKIIEIQNTESIQKQIQKEFSIKSDKQSVSLLQHFLMDGSFDSQSIFNIIKSVHEKGDPNSYYKFIIIKDQPQNTFTCENENQYPFKLQTIIMSYYGQHQHKVSSPRLQQKIDNLKIVTEKLKKNANFNDAISKLHLQQYPFPFSLKTKLENFEEFDKIIKDILKANDQKSQFNSYARLILRLEQIQKLNYLSEDEMNNELEHLIKASYPSIPLISFKKEAEKTV